jgi:hypothetical protein
VWSRGKTRWSSWSLCRWKKCVPSPCCDKTFHYEKLHGFITCFVTSKQSHEHGVFCTWLVRKGESSQPSFS